ncbi:acetylglucosamine transferase [Rhodovulum visakhapatnamense]|uniref:Putative O-linked N-acetylglucosamine transferase (SPINDLY family) n=1 Tax=Rhodovulum visakhapatnamense TaxID=364297 RepID=A0A4R8G3L9_9RHOB|nr:acetylglucosamine transferase [Rhodovulum visakhapatnamense]TDX29696.1 putative O-linked N-acetylglucosamine transferase (SPINDLY family) [Rhodovulum visakhapatnamense]
MTDMSQTVFLPSGGPTPPAGFLSRTGRTDPDPVPDLDALTRMTAACADAAAVVDLASRAPQSAAAIYRIWLDRNGARPDAWAAWFNLSVLLNVAGDLAGTYDAAVQALRMKPDLWQAALAAGQAAEALGDRAAAIAFLRQALPPAEGRVALHKQLGRMLELDKSLGASAEELRASLLIEPHQPDVIQHLVHTRQKMAAWPPAELAVPGLGTAEAELWCGPLATLALHDDPEMQRRVAADWIARNVPDPGERLAPPDGYRHDRIRLGYLSSDFCRHAMSYLIAELLERHDRSRFEVTGYCVSPEDGSDVRARILAALDHHVPVGTMTDEEAARRIRADEIDILIDLNGLTSGGRPGILRWKPAPVQATYLGYIGSVPVPELDWLLCDAITVPEEETARYSPAPLRIEGCYQANDGHQPDLPAVSRASEGLPEDRFVFVCVSHHYKITEPVFAAWCRIAAAAPETLFWLIEDTPESVAALSARWQASGLAPDRLIFAPRVDPARYRARLALGDLFLDTTPYNAGTIASDALRMGLPVLTMAGRTFSARMGTSLLTAVGLTDCIATGPEDYVSRAVAMATDPARRPALRGPALAARWTETLGDCADFARRFETALVSVVKRP